MANDGAKPQISATAGQWHRERELLADALELPVCERGAYIDRIAADNSQMRTRLLELIAAYETPSAAEFESPAVSVTTSHIETTASLIGRHIGQYRIETEIGSGGMGTVFRAVRADDEYQKKVAIKLVRGAAFSSHAAEMFRRERQVLANLEHPNIARLLDGGTTEDRTPYLVMEYVEGETITAYCESRKLGVEERLRLFLKICSAVQYAHQNFVIHRDLKPANLLVSESAEPKLLDFGIAKVINIDQGVAGVTAWQAVTPAYASPEQIAGDAVTTASDIYSLGLVLYELLAGVQPFSTFNNSRLGLQRAVMEHDPDLPSSTGLSNYSRENRDKVVAQLKGDLDSIVSKAIRKRAAERYASVEQFSEDIRRHFAALPVIAHQSTAGYRTRKFIRRNKTSIAAALLVLCSLVTGIVLTEREARIARAQQARAERRFTDVRQLASSLLFDLHDAIQDLPGSTPARKLLVEKALKYLDSLASEDSNDPSLARELAAAYERVGELQGHYLADNLGETSNSLISYRKALRIRQRLGGEHDSAWQDRLSLAESYRRVASQMQAMNQLREALAELQKAIEITKAIAQIQPSDLAVLNEMALDYQIFATMQEQSWFEGWGDLADALESDRKAIEVASQILVVDPKNLDAERSLGNDTLQTANAQSDVDDFVHGVESFNQALQIFRYIAQQSNAVKDRRRVAVVLNQLGQLYDRQGRWKLSLQYHEDGLKIYQELVAKDPKNALLRQGLAIALVNVGDGKSKLGKFDEGRSDINHGIALMRTLMTDPNEQQRHVLAEMSGVLATNFARSHEPYHAKLQYETALEMFEELYSGPVNTEFQIPIANCRLGIGEAQELTGKYDAAVMEFQQVLKLTSSWVRKGYRGALNRDALRDAAKAYSGLGDVEVSKVSHSEGTKQQEHWKQAIGLYKRSLEIGKQLPPFAQLDVTDFRAAEVSKQLALCHRELEFKTSFQTSKKILNTHTPH